MTYTPDRCEKREYPRSRKGNRDGDYAYAASRAKLHKRSRHLERGYDVAYHFAEVIVTGRRPQSSETRTDRIRREFEELSSRWRRETCFSSSLDEKVLNPAYQSIIAMGSDAVPLVLEELNTRRGHWFWALHFMTGADPVPEGANIEVARQAWLKWGREKGLLK